jgi:hypothetical protein
VLASNCLPDRWNRECPARGTCRGDHRWVVFGAIVVPGVVIGINNTLVTIGVLIIAPAPRSVFAIVCPLGYEARTAVGIYEAGTELAAELKLAIEALATCTRSRPALCRSPRRLDMNE